MSLYEFWTSYYFHSHPGDLEVFVERVLQTEHPELVVESRGGSSGFSDDGRDVVIKRHRTDAVPCGVVQVSAEVAWRDKFRRELRALVGRTSQGQTAPETWIFATVQRTHMKSTTRSLRIPADEDDEISWALELLRGSGLSTNVEIWGLRDFVAVVADEGRGRQVRLEFGAPEALHDQLADLAEAFDIFTNASLRGVSGEIPVLGRLPRSEYAELEATLERHREALLVGEGGSGKSSLMAQLVDDARSQGTVVLLIRASSFAQNDGIDSIEGRLAIRESLLVSLRRLAAVLPCLVAVDQLDSVKEGALFNALLGLLTSAGGIERVSVLVACRDWQADKDPELGRLQFPRVVSKPMDDESARVQLRGLGIDSPSPVLLDLAKNLLNLSLIADLASGGEDLSAIQGKVDLWGRYRLAIKTREGNSAYEEALKLSRESLRNGSREFPIDSRDEASIDRLTSRGVLLPSRGETYRFRHQDLHDYLFAWDAAMRRQATAHGVNEEVGEQLGRGVLKWMLALYLAVMPELAARFLRDVLLGEWQFYTKADLLDVLLDIPEPNESIVDILVDATADSSLASYFFLRLDQPGWLDGLISKGAFSHPTPLRRLENGGVQMVHWPAAEYLARVASAAPERVASVAENLVTDNPAVYRTLLEGITRMPPSKATRLVPAVIRWVDMDSHWLVPDEARGLALRLATEGAWRPALAITERLLRPQIQTGREDSPFRPEAEPSVDDYIFKLTLEQVVPALQRARLGAVLRLLERCLRDALALERGAGSYVPSLWWRSAIEDHEQNWRHDRCKDLVLQALRDALETCFSSSPVTAKQVLERYLHARLDIFRRLALHTISNHVSELRDLAATVLVEPAHLYSDSEIHEYYELLKRSFPLLPVRDRRAVLDALCRPIPAKRGVGKKRQELRTRKRHLHVLTAVHDYLDKPKRLYYESLIAEFGELEYPGFVAWHSAGWGGAPSPLSDEQIDTMSPEELAHYVENWQPGERRSFDEPDAEGLGTALQHAVIRRPDDFSRAAELFARPKLRELFAYNFLRGLEETLRSGKPVHLEPVLGLFEKLVALDEREFPPDTSRLGFRVSWLHGVIADILREILGRSELSPTEAQGPRLLDLIRVLLTHPEPDRAHEETYGHGDPEAFRINTVRGKALDTFMLYGHWRSRILNEQGVSPRETIAAEVMDTLDVLVDPRKETSPAIHSGFGKWIRYLYWLSPQWVREQWPLIFPTSEGFEEFWSAALIGTLYGAPFPLEIYPLMREEFRRALRQPSSLGSKTENFLGHVGEHLGAAFWAGIEEIDTEDSLVQEVFGSPAKEAMRSFLWILGRNLRDSRIRPDSAEWKRLRHLWAWRMQKVELSDAEGSEREASGFAWWLEAVPEPLTACYELVLSTTARLKDEMHVRDVIQFLGRDAAHAPREAVGILDELTIRSGPSYAIGMEHENVRSVLTAALQTGGEARALAISAINRFGSHGEHRFRDLLQ